MAQCRLSAAAPVGPSSLAFGASVLSDGITSGLFPPVVTLAIRRVSLQVFPSPIPWGGGVARHILVASKFEETRPFGLPTIFWRFATTGLPSSFCYRRTAIIPHTCGAKTAPVKRQSLTLLPWGQCSFKLDLACLRVLLGKIMMSQDVHFCCSWKRERALVLFNTSSHVEFRNSTSPKEYLTVLRYEVHFAFSLSRIGKVPN